ncbi:hypothetical protein M011DRAFT_400729 [Sporormia fimetaria CBS 119925]|uniref:Uncharacterized protein n=1 Tax=Sporormia fimetaria CBS 119925 TaxID=1340428 RepID=A0A6A6VCQ8_9PLEO|nr:hypothetical protein M011DRAFT_400729 [Sporormia fimetaria CBS 119925]
MSPTYRITEPHPSLPPTQRLYTGRGGAGNIHLIDPSSLTSPTTASGPASRIKLSPPPSNAYFTSGRGGAGNVHREKERAMFSFDEELAQQERLREHAAPVYHIGRGGAGNLVSERGGAGGETDSLSSREEKGEEGGTVRRSLEGAWGRVSKQFSRHS